jgi:hypothetical protein
VNAGFFQIVFGMNAGRSSFSSRFTQKMEVGKKASTMDSGTALGTSRILLESPVTILSRQFQLGLKDQR